MRYVFPSGQSLQPVSQLGVSLCQSLYNSTSVNLTRRIHRQVLNRGHNITIHNGRPAITLQIHTDRVVKNRFDAWSTCFALSWMNATFVHSIGLTPADCLAWRPLAECCPQQNCHKLPLQRWLVWSLSAGLKTFIMILCRFSMLAFHRYVS